MARAIQGRAGTRCSDVDGGIHRRLRQYCLLIGGFLAARVLSITAVRDRPRGGRALDARRAHLVRGPGRGPCRRRGGRISLLGLSVSMRSLYTPMLVLTTGFTSHRLGLFRASLAPNARDDGWRVMRFATVAGVVATALLSPVLYAVGVRLSTVGIESSRVFWRSSPPGVDLLALLLPNPNHPFSPAWVSDWLPRCRTATSKTWRRSCGARGNAGVGGGRMAAVAVVGWSRGAIWCLGPWPFVHVAGLNTFVPGPGRFSAMCQSLAWPGRPLASPWS